MGHAFAELLDVCGPLGQYVECRCQNDQLALPYRVRCAQCVFYAKIYRPTCDDRDHRLVRVPRSSEDPRLECPLNFELRGEVSQNPCAPRGLLRHTGAPSSSTGTTMTSPLRIIAQILRVSAMNRSEIV